MKHTGDDAGDAQKNLFVVPRANEQTKVAYTSHQKHHFIDDSSLKTMTARVVLEWFCFSSWLGHNERAREHGRETNSHFTCFLQFGTKYGTCDIKISRN